MTATDTEVLAEPVVEDVLMTVPAHAAALAWLNAFLATGQEEDRHLLFRTLCLEFFPTGLQLISTNGSALFRTWVPAGFGEGAPWPEKDEAPTRRVVVMDADGFGVGFMRNLLAATKEREDEMLTITTAKEDDEATPALGAEFLTQRVTLRACGQRLDLRVFEKEYPNWRAVQLGIDAVERLDSLTIGSRIFAIVGRLKCVHAVDLEFYGDTKHIAFVARGGSEVRGLLMPMRKPEKAATASDDQAEDEE